MRRRLRRREPRGRSQAATTAAQRNRRERLALIVSVATLGVTYLGVAVAAGWWPFSGPEAGVRIDTVASMFNPSTSDDAAAEYVCVVNTTDGPVDLLDWELHDSAGHFIRLPRFSLLPNRGLRVHTGPGRPSDGDVFGTSRSPIWNNDGDVVALVDADGHKIDSRPYSRRPENDASRSCG